MTHNGPARLKQIFIEAIEMPVGARADFVLRACGDDIELHREVSELIKAHHRVEGVLEQPHTAIESTLTSTMAVDPAMHRPTDSPSESSQHPSAIGPYKILGVMGEGGMGVVYRALQEDPIRREVAVKVIKIGMDTREVIARFEVERQALALMSHPGIAKVVDAGSTAEGRLYFVMELVRGVPITDYCDSMRLDASDRLQLFTKVCLAVQHAHQKGIIHRDLKPSNVLVSVDAGGDPMPVIIDFGIAKAVHQRLTDRTLFTEHHQFLGTPEYMSPEQAEMSKLDIDTRTDVYALGVLLYELLTGTTPLDASQLRSAGFAEICRMIREVDPPKPSTRIEKLGSEGVTLIARRRRAEPRTLSRLLRNDLDWIVMKCLDKDRTRRYESASELAADVERHLRLEPVSAGPPSAFYRISRFVRKNRVTVTGAALFLALLLAALSTTTWLYLDTLDAKRKESEARADEALARALADTQALAARMEARKALGILHFLTGVMVAPNPDKDGRDVRVTTVLARARANLQKSFDQDPDIGAAICDTLGMTYLALGLFEEAEDLVRRALDFHRQESASGLSPQVLESQLHLGAIRLKRGDPQQARELSKSVVEHGLTAGLTESRIAWGHLQLARANADLADFDGSEREIRQAIDVLVRAAGEHGEETLRARRELVAVLDLQGRVAETETELRRLAADCEESLGVQHTITCGVKNDLGHVLRLQNKPDPAREVFERVLATQKHVLGGDHPDTLETTNNLALTAQTSGDYSDSERLFREVLASYSNQLGESHPHTLRVMVNLAGLYLAMRRLDEAETLLRNAMKLQRDAIGFEADALLIEHSLAEVLYVRQKYLEAVPHFERVAKQAALLLPENHLNLAIYRGTLGKCLIDLKRYEEAERQLRDCAIVVCADFGDDHPFALEALHQLARLYNLTGNPNGIRLLRSEITRRIAERRQGKN